jgi:chromosome segregation ATPase
MHLLIKEFEKVVESINASNKRLHTLMELAKSGRISQSTFEYLKRGYESEARSIEERRKSLLEGLENYFNEMDQQIKSVEKRIVSIEERYAVGEIDEESYRKQIEALQVILQGIVEEFESVKKSINILKELKIEAPAG